MGLPVQLYLNHYRLPKIAISSFQNRNRDASLILAFYMYLVRSKRIVSAGGGASLLPSFFFAAAAAHGVSTVYSYTFGRDIISAQRFSNSPPPPATLLISFLQTFQSGFHVTDE